jgi:hypothetical protein
MWIEKLWEGVLRVLTPLGPRYLQPTFLQRVYLLWIFRNFQTLPVKVLTPFQLRFIESMSQKQGSPKAVSMVSRTCPSWVRSKNAPQPIPPTLRPRAAEYLRHREGVSLCRGSTLLIRRRTRRSLSADVWACSEGLTDVSPHNSESTRKANESPLRVAVLEISC